MSVQFRCVEVGPFQTNCYTVWDGNTKMAAIIDPGGDQDRIANLIASLGIDVHRILLTHAHPDHSFHAGELSDYYGAEIGIHPGDVDLLTESLFIAEVFYDMSRYVPFRPSVMLEDGTKLRLGGSEIQVIHTPGHSPGGVSFQTDAGVFCGDTVFAGSIGRTDFPGGSSQQLIEAIRTRLLSLGPQTKLYPGHGPATTVAAELAHNPYVQR